MIVVDFSDVQFNFTTLNIVINMTMDHTVMVKIVVYIMYCKYCFRTNALLEKVCEGVTPRHFFGCLWDCLASNAAVRLPAISFALAHYDKRLSTEDQLHIMGTNIDTMVSTCILSVILFI